MKTFSNLLVGVDLSENCLPALKQAMSMVERTDAGLKCLFVLAQNHNEKPNFESFFRTDEAREGMLEEKAITKLTHWLSEQTGLGTGEVEERLQPTVKTGKPAEEILRFADESECDLIVTGTHGRTGLQRMWIGSVAERVVRHSTIPVLTVRTQPPPQKIYDRNNSKEKNTVQ